MKLDKGYRMVLVITIAIAVAVTAYFVTTASEDEFDIRKEAEQINDVLPPPLGPYIDEGFDPSGMTSFDGKILMTYVFYWYDINTNSHIRLGDKDVLTSHPYNYPDYRDPDFSYYSVDWWKQELREMSRAGIDIVLPVYWGAPYTTGEEFWCDPGIEVLVQAMDELKQNGETPPQIGMFYDTSTLARSPWGNLDLTNFEQRQYFWGTIRNFFSMIPPRHWAQIGNKPVVVLYMSIFAKNYNQDAFNYLRLEFQNHFDGKNPYVIRDISWTGVITESYYKWGAALSQPYIYQTAQIGPGFDNDAVYDLWGMQHYYKDRENGYYYESSWQTAIASGKDIIGLETWNEYHEATNISNSYEYGRQYLTLTRKYNNIWRNVSNDAEFSSQSVPVNLNTNETNSVEITLRNLGTQSWTKEGGYKLGSINPTDNEIWGINRVELDEGEVIEPGEEKTFVFSVKAPEKAGVYSFQWRMLEENINWFGDDTDNVEINVTGEQTGLSLNFSLDLFKNNNSASDNVYIKISNSDGVIAEAETTTDQFGKSGAVTIKNIESGTYSVFVKPRKYISKTWSGDLMKGESKEISFSDSFLCGDLNETSYDFLNSLDFSSFIKGFREKDKSVDCNGDGVLNSVDYSIMIMTYRSI